MKDIRVYRASEDDHEKQAIDSAFEVSANSVKQIQSCGVNPWELNLYMTGILFFIE